MPTPGQIGGGYNPNGTPSSGTNVFLNSWNPTSGIGPVSIHFARPQATVTFDLFAYLSASGTSVPITLKANGSVVGTRLLTNADAIIGGTNPGQLGGRFRIQSSLTFQSAGHWTQSTLRRWLRNRQLEPQPASDTPGTTCRHKSGNRADTLADNHPRSGRIRKLDSERRGGPMDGRFESGVAHRCTSCPSNHGDCSHGIGTPRFAIDSRHRDRGRQAIHRLSSCHFSGSAICTG